MAVVLPPVPYKAPVLDAKGYLAPAWTAWFKQFFLRIGGTSALSNTELADLPALELAAVEARVTATESDIAALQLLTTSQGTTISTHTTQINDLGQGPVL